MMKTYIPYDADCTCAPCKTHQLEERMNYVLDHLPIDGKIHPRDVSEFRRLVSINRELTFTEKLMELDAFSALTAAEQRDLVYKVAVGAMSMMEEEATDLGSEMLGLGDFIRTVKSLRAADARV
jgi:uncharacterized LabA/DUF88 family protein